MELILKVGDLLDEEADAILVSADPMLDLSHGLGGAILSRGNEGVQRELNEHLARLRLGTNLVTEWTVVRTSAGNLRARHLLHCVVVVGFYCPSTESIARVVRAALDRAVELGCRSVAMPAIATGYGEATITEFAKALSKAIGVHGLALDQLTVVVRKPEELVALRRDLDGSRTKTLYRPVGLYEMALILRANGRRFPPRKPEQPIFYPVLELSYAEQIARDWNTRDAVSGHAGYVTEFDVDAPYLSRFDEHVVGGARHRELWVPADQLGEFNESIIGRIRMQTAFFGPEFTGVIHDGNPSERVGARSAFLDLCYLKREDRNPPNPHRGPVSLYAQYLYFPYWTQVDFESDGIPSDQRDWFLRLIAEGWARVIPDASLVWNQPSRR